MNEPITLPEKSRLGLVDLYVKSEQAKREYRAALNATIAALGFDPLDPLRPINVNLDTGIVTIAPPQPLA